MTDGIKINGACAGTAPFVEIQAVAHGTQVQGPHIQRINPFSGNGVPTQEKLLAALTRSFEQRAERTNQVFTMDEYLRRLSDKPALYMRPVSKYILDAMDYLDNKYGSKKIRALGRDITEHQFVDPAQKELRSVNRFRGHPLFWHTFRNALSDFSKMPYPNKAIVVHGPTSTGKSCFFDDFLKGLETYSREEEGVLTTYQWVFPSKLFNIGFGKDLSSDQEIKQSDIVLTVPADKNTMPIFLFDEDERKQFVDALIEEGKLPDDFNRDFIISGKLDEMSAKILDGLLKVYYTAKESDDEDTKRNARIEAAKQARKHIQVVRWNFSSNGGKGLVLKQPTTAPNTILKPITPQVNWDDLPPQILNVLYSAGLFSQEGLLPTSNHGIFYRDDMFKDVEKHKGLKDYLYLLRLAEKGDANITDPNELKTVNESFDILNVGTTNDGTLRLVRELDPDNWDAINGRLVFIPIEHERCYSYVGELFNDKLQVLVPKETKRHVSPNVIKAFSLWTTMTHLFPYGNTPYYDSLQIDSQTRDKLKNLLGKMTLLEKALLYEGENLEKYKLDGSSKYTTAEQDLLQNNAAFIADEYNIGFGENHLEVYEGCVGLPSRVAEVILARATKLKPDEPVTVIEIFEAIEQACKREFGFEVSRNKLIQDIQKMQQEKSKGKSGGKEQTYSLSSLSSFPTTKELLNQVKEHIQNKIRFDVCQATGFWKTKNQIKFDLRRYFAHAKAASRNEEVVEEYRVPKNSHKPNEAILHSVEKIFGFDVSLSRDDQKREQFRKEKITAFGIWQLDHAGVNSLDKIDQVFPDLAQKLEAQYTLENKLGIKNFIEDLKAYVENGESINGMISLENDHHRRRILLDGIQGLMKEGYNMKSIIKEVSFAFKDYI